MNGLGIPVSMWFFTCHNGLGRIVCHCERKSLNVWKPVIACVIGLIISYECLVQFPMKFFMKSEEGRKHKQTHRQRTGRGEIQLCRGKTAAC